MRTMPLYTGSGGEGVRVCCTVGVQIHLQIVRPSFFNTISDLRMTDQKRHLSSVMKVHKLTQAVVILDTDCQSPSVKPLD